MKIEAFERDAENKIYAIEGEVKVFLNEAFVAHHKPQVDDEIDENNIEQPANQ
jgi:hypothetical protein